MQLNITLEEALNRASHRLREKMKHSIELLEKGRKLSLLYDSENGYFLAFSGGKDSQALYHITQLWGGQFKAHFSPTTIDPPDVIRFVKTNYPDVEFAKVKKNMYDMAVEKQILPTQRVRWCCAEFKEMAGAGKVTLIGIRHSESHRRSKRNEVEISNRKFSGDFEMFTQYQEETIRKKYKNINQDQFSYDKEKEIRCISGKDSILISPIIDWTESDVWEFLNKVVQVPHCSLYDKGYKRIGCIMCPMSSHKQKLKECADYPHVKAKWLEAIKKIRQGGVSAFEPTHRHNTGELIHKWGGKMGIHQSERQRILGPARPEFAIPRQWLINDSNWQHQDQWQGRTPECGKGSFPNSDDYP